MKYLSKFAYFQVYFDHKDKWPDVPFVDDKKPIFATHYMDLLKVLFIVGFIVVGMIASFQ